MPTTSGAISAKNTQPASGRFVAMILAFVAGASFGLAGAVSRVVAQQGFTVSQIVVAQTWSALIILGALMIVRFRPRMSAKEALMLMGVGCAQILSGFCYYTAISMLSVGTAVAIQFQYVWIVVVIAAVANRKLPSKWVVLATALIIFGTLFASGLAGEFLAGGLQMSPLGLAIAFACAVLYGLFIFLNGKVATEHHPVTRSFFMMVGGVVLASILCPGFYVGECDVMTIVPGGIAMGLISSVIPCVCLAASASKLPGGLVAILTSSELPAAVLAGFLMFGEEVTPLILFGVVLILVSIVLSEMDSFIKKKAPS